MATTGQALVCRFFGFPVLTTSSASAVAHPHSLISLSPGMLVTVLVWKQPEISSFRILDGDMNLYWESGMQLIPLFSFIEKYFASSDSARPFFSPSVDVDMPTGQDGGGAGEKGRRQKVELLREAIHGLLEENRVKLQQQHGEEEGSMVTRDQEEDLLLSSLLSKLNALEEDVDLDDAELNSSHEDLESRKEVGLGDIAKDLNKIKRQNMITHILVGTLLVITAVWQFKEVSFLLGVQEKLSDPFKSVGNMFKRTLKRGEQTMNEASPLPPVSIPDVTDLPALGIGDSDS